MCHRGNFDTDAFAQGLLELCNTSRADSRSPAQVLYGRSADRRLHCTPPWVPKFSKDCKWHQMRIRTEAYKTTYTIQCTHLTSETIRSQHNDRVAISAVQFGFTIVGRT